jgi:hypothetical protein
MRAAGRGGEGGNHPDGSIEPKQVDDHPGEERFHRETAVAPQPVDTHRVKYHPKHDTAGWGGLLPA